MVSAGGRASRRGRAPRAGTIRECTAREYEVSNTTAPRSPRSPRFPTCPRSDNRTVADLADWPYPKQQWCRSSKVVHAASTVEDLPRAPAGDGYARRADHRPRCGKRPEERLRAMVRGWSARPGYDEGRAPPCSSAGFSGIGRRGRRHGERPGRHGGQVCRSEHAVDGVSGCERSRPRSRRCAEPVHVVAHERGVEHAQGQQVDRDMRSYSARFDAACSQGWRRG